MPPKPTGRDPYLVKSVVHSSQLLAAFRTSGEALPLREISSRSGLPKSMAFRLIYTLERCGMIEKVGDNLYRSHIRPFKQKPFRVGYAAQGTDYQFSREVSAGLQRAAVTHGVDLICVDNKYNPKIAQRNAEVLVREKVDLVIEFQTDEHVAAAVAAKYREADIPLIALEVPHPGATYFGANNYEAGLIGGRHLGRWAKQDLARRRGRDHLDRARACRQPAENAAHRNAGRDAGDLRTARRLPRHLHGWRWQTQRELRRRPQAPAIEPRAADTRRRRQRSQRAWRLTGVPRRPPQRWLRRHGSERRPRRTRRTAGAGTRLIGSVAYFPEKYGGEILALALDILHRRPVPPAVFVKHQLVTPDTVDHIYPNDRLMQLTGTHNA